MQAQAEKLEKRFGIVHGDRQLQIAQIEARRLLLTDDFLFGFDRFFKGRFEFKTEAKNAGSERASGKARAELVEEATEQKRERLELFDGVIKLHFFFKGVSGFGNGNGAGTRALCQCVKTDAFLAEPLGKIEKRKSGELATGSNAPALERFGGLRRWGEHADRQFAEMSGFFARGDHMNAGESAGCDNGGSDVLGDGDVREKAALFAARKKLLSNGASIAQQTFQAGDIRDYEIGSGIFNARRNRPAQIEKRGVRAFFEGRRTKTNCDADKLRDGGFGHAELDTGATRSFAHGDNMDEGRRALNESQGAAREIRFLPDDGLHEKIRNVNGGEHGS